MSELFALIRREIVFTASRSSGPGGQNVNKVNSKVTLRWSLADSKIAPEIKTRLFQRLRPRLTMSEEIVIQTDEFRDQGRNKEACLEKLESMLASALKPQKRRRPTKPKKSSKEKRLQGKKARGQTKALRRKGISDT